MQALRDAIGPDAKIRLDANGAWSVRTAEKTLAAMASLDIELVEQPVASLRKMAKLRRGADVRIAADESVATPQEAEHAVAMEACDLATVKLSKVGGHVAALEIAERLPVYLSSALDGPVGIAAAAHTAQALRKSGDAGVAHGLATQRLFAETIAARGCELSGDHAAPTPRRRPGRRDRRCAESWRRAHTILSPGAGDSVTRRLTSTHRPNQPQHRSSLRPGRGAGPLRRAPRRNLPRLALHPTRPRPLPPTRNRGQRHPRRALGGLLRARRGAGRGTRPAVVACTSGSAAANLHPAVVEADEAGVPLIVLTADRPPELRGIGAGQTIDQLKLYGGAVRWFCEVGTHDADDAGLIHFRSTACRAYAAARGEPRPGPVHLNIAFRDPLGPEPVDGDVTATSALALTGAASGR